MPRTPPPHGYVGMKEALAHLHERGLTTGESMFYKYVRAGRITPYGPRKYKYYALDELNKFADEEIGHSRKDLELVFARATLDDLEGITTVAQKLFKHPHAPSISTETRRSWLLKEPRGHYIVKRPNGDVIAWLHIVALTDETIKRYMNRELYGRNITSDDVQAYAPGRPQSCIVLSIGTDPDLDKGRRDGKTPVGSRCISILLHGVSQDLTLLGMQGIIIDKLYAWSETKEGILMCTKMGMQQYAQPYKPPKEPRRYTFYLDIQQSTMPMVKSYQKALSEWRSAHRTQPQHKPVVWEDAAQRAKMPSSAETAKATSPPQKTATYATEPQKTVSTDQPPGTITLQELAERLHRSQATLKGHFKSKYDDLPDAEKERSPFHHIRVPIPARPGQFHHYFTPEQAGQIAAWIEAHTK